MRRSKTNGKWTCKGCRQQLPHSEGTQWKATSVQCAPTAKQMEESHTDDIDNKKEDVTEKKKVYVSDD